MRYYLKTVFLSVLFSLVAVLSACNGNVVGEPQEWIEDFDVPHLGGEGSEVVIGILS